MPIDPRAIGPFSPFDDSAWAPATMTPRTRPVDGLAPKMLPGFTVTFTNTGGANLLVSSDGIQFQSIAPNQSGSLLSPQQITIKSSAGEVPWTVAITEAA